jgi:hypothetical protein
MTSPLIPQPKIVLEGTHLTRKTDIAFLLAEHPRIVGNRKHRWHIPLVSSEWETFSDEPPTKANPGRSLIDFLPREEERAFAAYENWMRLFELQCDYYWIVDRFHISTMSYQRLVHGRTYDFGWLEKRLKALNFFLVQTARSADTFEKARADRLVYSENQHRYNDLQKFVEEQEFIRELVAASQLPTLEVDVSDDDIERAANEILDWVEAAGGFWDRPWAS